MTTLYDVMLNMARRVRAVYSGVATGGTVTTLIDTTYRNEEDDEWNGQTLFVLSGDNAGLTRTIIDFVKSTSTLTFSPQFTDVIAADDTYLIVSARREDMVQAVNAGLAEIGTTTEVDATLTVDSNKYTYDLPAGVNHVVRIELALDGSNGRYTTLFTWQEIDGKIYLPKELGVSDGNTIRIYYNKSHSYISADDGVIEDAIPIQLIGAIAAYYFQWQQFASEANVHIKDETMLAKAQNDMMMAKSQFRVQRLSRDPKHGSY